MSDDRTVPILDFHAAPAPVYRAVSARLEPTIPDHFGDEGLTMAQIHHRQELLRHVD